MLDLSNVINNPNFSSKFTVYRKTGHWTLEGKFIQEETPFSYSGVVTIAKGKELSMIPEGDRVGGEILISSTKPLFQTRSLENIEGTSDEVLWHGERYKVYVSKDDSRWGFYKAICQRIKGK